MKRFWTQGEFFVWITGAGLAVSMIMVCGLMVAVLYHGLGYFWPPTLERFQLRDGQIVLGTVTDREKVFRIEKTEDASEGYRLQVKRGNRDVYGDDFVWIDEVQIESRQKPKSAIVLERTEWGDFYGFLKEVREGDRVISDSPEGSWEALQRLMPAVHSVLEEIHDIERNQVGKTNYHIEQARLTLKKLELDGVRAGPEVDRLKKQIQEQRDAYNVLEKKLFLLKKKLIHVAVCTTVDGQDRQIPLDHIVRFYQPNQFGLFGKLGYMFSKAWEFVADEPRESNTEGGVFPAIFGTVMMVMIMSIVVMPLGVLAAFFLREYAQQGPVISLVRIAVNNLAGVPSIVFGVFGVGFFIYFVGGGIDRMFFPEALPTPTFGTGGILWASLTLALLTVPVVIVATEEGLAAVPKGMREAALALGSTRFEMLRNVVLPAVMPSILTGLILAMARAAGEVAPLMITGVVKLAPSLPVDGYWPFLHLDRKFMHLGFHIYDVGFQSPNVDAAKPMVYATTLLLLGIVLLLNSAAILLRTRLRKKLIVSTL